MKQHSIIALILLLAALMASCEKMLDVYDDGNRELVLNGIPSAGKQAFVYFAQTRFFLDSSINQPAQGATVTLTVNGTPMHPSSEERCKYFFPYTLQENDQLSIDVSAGERHVHAETYIPPYPEVSGFRASNFNSPHFKLFEVDLQLDDHASFNEYYNIVISERDSGIRFNEWTAQYDTVDTIHSAYFLVPYNPKVTSTEVCPYIPLGGYLYSRVMFTDKLIDGTSENLRLFVLQTIDTNEVTPFKHEYLIQVESITPARWNYTISSSQQAGATSFFAEQGDVWSNIEGGLGIFAGIATRKFAFCPDTLPPLTQLPLPSTVLQNAHP